MKRSLIFLALVAAPLLAQAQVGVSVNIGEPGFFGQIDLGNRPPPPVVYSAPVIIQQQGESYPPVYLRVPEEQHRNWRNYCYQYNACNRQVYFVTEDWYNNSYEHHGYDHEHDHGHGHDHEEEHHHDREEGHD